MATPRVEYEGRKSELEIELKYFDGEPVIRTIERVSKPGRRVYSSVKNIPACLQRPGRVDHVHPARCHERQHQARDE